MSMSIEKMAACVRCAGNAQERKETQDWIKKGILETMRAEPSIMHSHQIGKDEQ